MIKVFSLVVIALLTAQLAGCAQMPGKAAEPAAPETVPVAEPRHVPAPAALPEARPADPKPPLIAEPRGTATLSTGIVAYENGKFAQAAKTIQASLDQGLTEADQVRAHKLLAFMHCIAGREPACRASFARALKVDPRMDLSAAEAGHPIWGPVFRSVKQSAGDRK